MPEDRMSHRAPWECTFAKEQRSRCLPGKKPRTDHKYFEVLSLCILQAGLSWASVRRSWPRYRSAFLDFEIEERAPVARPAPAHAGPAQASLQDAEGQDLEILVVRARFLAGKAAAALLLCERTLPGRAVAHSIFRHMNDEDGTLRRLTPSGLN